MHPSDRPEGFTPHTRSSPVTRPWEPLFSRVEEDRVRLGVWLRECHCNARGLAHGGLIAALSDNAMGLSCAQVLRMAGEKVAGLVTINLSTDYMGVAPVGSWLEFDTEFVKTGRSICFARSVTSADGVVIAAAAATFKRIDAKESINVRSD